MVAFDHLLEEMTPGVFGDPHVQPHMLAVHAEAERIVAAVGP